MKKTLSLMLLALLSGAGLLWLVARGSGYVLINYAGYQLEMSFWTALLALVALWLLLRWGLALLGWLLRAGGAFVWWRNRRQQSATSRREQGLAAIAGGDWPEAKRLLAAAGSGASSRTDRLLAARVLLECDERDQAQALLVPLLDNQDRAATLLAAQLSDRRATVIALLEPLAAEKKLPPAALRQLLDALLEERQWSAAAGLLKSSQLGVATEPLYRRWLEPQLTAAASLKELQQLWRVLPAAQREQPQLVAHYARRLCELDEPAEAEKLLLKTLQSQLKRSAPEFDRDCLAVLWLLPEPGLNKRMRALESLLEAKPDAQLAYALARLCQQGQLWARARDFANQSLRLQATAATQKLLGELYRQLGDDKAAEQHFRRGLELALQP